MISNMTLIEAIHCEVQEIQLQAGLDDNDFMSLYKLIEELRERFEQNG
jgi:hypothetical protein